MRLGQGIDLQSKFLGAMIGSALGDAIGELAFQYPQQAHLLRAVAQSKELRYTDDTAVAGAISGAYLGVDAIPSDWTTRLENRSYIEELAKKLYAIRAADQ